MAAAAIGRRRNLDDRLLGRGVDEVDASFVLVKALPLLKRHLQPLDQEEWLEAIVLRQF